MKVYQAIANEIDKINRGQDQAEESLDQIIKDLLPSGSGFDAEITIDYNTDKAQCEKYKLRVPYHCMNENGFYDGWVEVEYTITPSFMDYNIKENWKGYTGKYKENLREYLIETIIYSLDKEIACTWDAIEQRMYYSEVSA